MVKENVRENTVYITSLKNLKDFELNHIFDCGQCFRWEKEEDGSYTGVVLFRYNESWHNVAANIKLKNSEATIQATKAIPVEVWENYFDLKVDYGQIKYELRLKDDKIDEAINSGEGIRILNQNKWETLISFLISQNNNIPRIKGCIQALSKNFGEPLGEFMGSERFGFPLPETLGKLTVEDLSECKLGYRAGYIIESSKQVINMGVKEFFDIEELDEMTAFEKIKGLKGVGPKVAHCILLFSFKKRESFPIDVWMKKVMADVYDLNKEKEIESFAKEKFGRNGGIAQQYLFYYIRELENNG